MTAAQNSHRLGEAIALHSGARLDEAAALYAEILACEPGHFEALQWLATLRLQRGEFLDALDLFDRALAIDADHVVCLNNRAAALNHLRRFDEAERTSARTLALSPAYAEAHFNRGNALRGLGELQEALFCFERGCDCKPDYALAHGNRGAVLRELGRPGEALGHLDRALSLWPQFTEAMVHRALALIDLGRFEEALESGDSALRVRPDLASAFNIRGIALRQLRRPDEALHSYERALALRPEDAKVLNNRGIALRDLGRLEEALQSYDRALQIDPGYADAHSNRGNVLRDLIRLQEALAAFQCARELAPAHADARWNESLCRLLMGDFARGWALYEWRWKVHSQKGHRREFTRPMWLGDTDIRGQTILLHAEQGLGDTLQFCRYASRVAALGAIVVLEVQASLKSLMQGLEGVSVVLAAGENLPHFDCHCPLLSLPLVFATGLAGISGRPYLMADKQKSAAWRSRLGGKGRMKIGLAWSGAAEHENDRNRSIPLAQFKALMDQSADYVCLQNEVRPADRAVLQQTPAIQCFGQHLQDFSDTAALIDNLDLVVTVDTGIAHLAGAMGKAVWILLPFCPDWRWMLDRDDSPWYQGATLFRQAARDQWGDVLARVKSETKQIYQHNQLVKE